MAGVVRADGLDAAGVHAALPEAMHHILDELCAEHGTIRNYVRSIGVSDATLATLESVLLV